MQSISSDNKELLKHLFSQMVGACRLIIKWNKPFNKSAEYLYSDENLGIMAATCMMMESIGEQIKKIYRIDPYLLENAFPDIKWKNVMGLRDRIAHGYFQLDEDIIFDVAKNETPVWEMCFNKIIEQLNYFQKRND